MRKYYLFLALMILSTIFAGSTNADEDSKHKLAEELISVMQIHNMADKMFEQAKLLQMSEIKNIISLGGNDAGAQELQEEITALIKKEFEWEVLKNNYIAVYEEVFNEDEIQGLLDFHKSTLGQKLIEKNPEIIRKSMEIGQKRMVTIIPGVQKLIVEWMTEQKSIQKNSPQKKEIVL